MGGSVREGRGLAVEGEGTEMGFGSVGKGPRDCICLHPPARSLGQWNQGVRLAQAETEGHQVASSSQRALQAGARLFIYHRLQEGSLDATLPNHTVAELQAEALSQPAHCGSSPAHLSAPLSQRDAAEKVDRPNQILRWGGKGSRTSDPPPAP